MGILYFSIDFCCNKQIDKEQFDLLVEMDIIKEKN
jgi:hypothetical protein